VSLIEVEIVYTITVNKTMPLNKGSLRCLETVSPSKTESLLLQTCVNLCCLWARAAMGIQPKSETLVCQQEEPCHSCKDLLAPQAGSPGEGKWHFIAHHDATGWG